MFLCTDKYVEYLATDCSKALWRPEVELKFEGVAPQIHANFKLQGKKIYIYISQNHPTSGWEAPLETI